MIKKSIIKAPIAAAVVGSMALAMSQIASAALFDRGGGLIYDDVLNITWLQDANYAKTSGMDPDGRMNFDDAINYAANLEYYDSVRDVTWSDWRMPKVTPVNGIEFNDHFSFDGTTDNGYNIRSTHSELSYNFYVNLGHRGYSGEQGFWPFPGFGFFNPGPFERMNGAEVFPYWTGIEYPPFSGMGFIMVYKTGSQHGAIKSSELLVWPVRDGDVAVVSAPAPEARVTYPASGEVLSGAVNLQAEKLNGNVHNISYQLGDILLCKGMAGSGLGCEWNSAELANGDYALKVVIEGFDGVKTRKTIPVSIVN